MASSRRPAPLEAGEPIVIVGAGPVGVHAAAELLRRDARLPLVMYGDEPWRPYQRVQLTALAAGEIGLEAIDNAPALPPAHRVIERYHCRVTAIDRHARGVRDAFGRWQPYARLVLAVGSRAHVPHIPGIDKDGVYTFRDLNDVQRLLARRARSRRTVVLGGGLLGVEAARALRRAGTDVVLLHQAPRLMNRQLDERAARMVQRELELHGVTVYLGDSVTEVLGGRTVERLRRRRGGVLDCDTLVVATGIRPNIDLAVAAGLAVGRGIRVDDRLQTSDPYIYAIGECAEHRGRITGLVAPGLDQAAVLADHLTGGGARYAGGLAAARLKVLGLEVCSIGEVGDDEDARRHTGVAHATAEGRAYRKLVLERGRFVGAIAVGAWEEWPRVQELVLARRRVSPWRRWRFARTGRLAGAPGGTDVAGWPARAIVCQCARVTRGTLTAAIAEGHRTIETLSARTSAARVCGSCRPLLAQLLGAAAAPAAMVGRAALIGATAVAAAVVALLAAPYVLPAANTVQAGWTVDALWQDGVWKQASGYTLLALSAAGLTLSLRKRVRRVSVGEFAWWRVAHGALGAAALAFLVAHTGLRFGANLNAYLMTCFTVLSLLGTLAGAAVAAERVPTRTSRRLRQATTLLHIVAAWPLPALLGFHVLSVYYF